MFVLTLHVSEPLAHTFAIVQFCGGTCLLDSSAAPGNTEFHMLLFGTIAALAFFLGCDLFGLAFFVVGSAFGDNRCRIVKVKRWSLGIVSYSQSTLHPPQKCDRPSDRDIIGRVSSFWIFRFNGPHSILMIIIMDPPPANLWPSP